MPPICTPPMRSGQSAVPDAPQSITGLLHGLRDGCQLPESLVLHVGDWRIRLETDSAELVAKLRVYFRHFLDDSGAADVVVYALEREPVDLGLTFRDWVREPGKKGRKEEYADLAGGRVVRKVRTGMQFLLAPREKMVVGPCVANENQVVNFLNALYINRMLARGYVLCHAAAVARGGRGVAISAKSGGGKSTLALHLLGRGASFVTNDRLLVATALPRARMSGVPKLPRINPGTALADPHLEGIIPPKRREELRLLDSDALWNLEEKYDVFIDECYAGVRFELFSPLDAYVVLTWKRHSVEPTRLARAELRTRPDLLAAIAKAPGPFYQPAGGYGFGGDTDADPAPFLEQLVGVPLYEISGAVDFARAREMIDGLLAPPAAA
jgi:HprK-related kinase B